MDTLKIFIALQIYELYNITFELALKLTVLTKCFRVSQKGNVSIIKGQCQNDRRDFLQHNILKVCVCVCVCVFARRMNVHVRFECVCLFNVCTYMCVCVCVRAQAREWMI